jgi:hypothetical protein
VGTSDEILKAILAGSQGGSSLAPYQAATSFGDAQRKAVAENDPYSGFVAVGNQGAQAVLSNPSLSLRDKILGAAISGLTGGTFQGLSDSYRARAQDAYTQSVLASLQGNTIERPDVLSPSIFADASNQANIFKLKAAMEEQSADRSFKNEIAKSIALDSIKGDQETKNAILKAKLEKPWLSDSIDQIVGGNKEARPIASDDPNMWMSPEEKQKASEQKAKDAIAVSDAMRKEITGRAEFQKFSEIGSRFNALRQALTDPAAIADSEFVYGVAKVLDPDSVVRESEAGQVIDSQSIPAALVGRLNKMLSGEQAISPTDRVDLLRLVGRNYDEAKAATDTLKQQYRDIAGRRKLLVDDILPPTQTRQVLPTEPTQRTQFIAQLASRFPNTDQGRAAFKEAVSILEK